MLKRLIDWLLYKLHLKKRREVPALESLLDIIPIVYFTAMFIEIFKWLGPIHYPWYKRIWFKIRWFFVRSRAVLIGY